MNGGLPTNSGSSMLSAIPQLLQLFTGTGKQTGSSVQTASKGTNPKAISALTQIIDQQGPSTDKAITNAIDLMMRAGVPTIGANERGSGIFNYSGTKEAMNQLTSTAAMKAAELDLQQKNQNTQNKMSAATNLGQLTGTSSNVASTSEKQAGVIDPLMGALALGGLMIGNKVLKGFGGSDNSANSTDNASSGNISFTPVTHTPDLGDIFDLGMKNFGGDVLSGLKSVTYDPTTGEQKTGGTEDLLGVLEQVASSSLLGTVRDFFGGLFGSGSSGASSGSTDSSSNSQGGTVICTRMHELGYMDDLTYTYDNAYGKIMAEENPKLLAWYHSWAIPFVTNWLHGNTIISKIIIQAIRPAVWLWSQQMKASIRVRYAQGKGIING